MPYYPSVPGRRMAWDEDGTVGVWATHASLTYPAVGGNPPGAWTVMSGATRIELNDEDTATASITMSDGSAPHLYVAVLFPELRDIDGFFVLCPTQSTGGGPDDADSWIAHSANTTNGFDGSWIETKSGEYWTYGDENDSWRADINTVSFSAMRGVKFLLGNTGGPGTKYVATRSFHVYGEIASGETPDRILILDNTTGLAYTADHDWGDAPRGTVHTEDLKLKNNSSTLTANTVVSTFEDLYGGSSSWYDIKEAGGSYASSLSITSIGSGVTYANLITVRKTIPDAAGLAVYAARMQVAVTSWT